VLYSDGQNFSDGRHAYGKSWRPTWREPPGQPAACRHDHRAGTWRQRYAEYYPEKIDASEATAQ
jgi:hypothetical protein